MSQQKRWVLGISGASGAVYGVRLLEVLSRMEPGVDLILSDAGRVVIREEMGIDLSAAGETSAEIIGKEFNINHSAIRFYKNNDFETPVASGSCPAQGMIIAPCSMGTLAAIAHGLADNLMRRAADVMIKQRRSLILLARETPLSTIHLENMLKLSRLGVVILPPIPAFYPKPKSIEEIVDFVVGRVLDVMEIDHTLYRRWKEEE